MIQMPLNKFWPGRQTQGDESHTSMIKCWGATVRNRRSRTRKQLPAARNRLPLSGFTLLEVLIAVAIMAIVLVSVYRLHSQTLSMASATRFYTQAPMLAQGIMAQLETTPADAVSGDSGDFGDKFPGYSWEVSIEEVSSEMLGVIADNLKQFNITVSLNENEYQYRVRAYRLLVE